MVVLASSGLKERSLTGYLEPDAKPEHVRVERHGPGDVADVEHRMVHSSDGHGDRLRPVRLVYGLAVRSAAAVGAMAVLAMAACGSTAAPTSAPRTAGSSTTSTTAAAPSTTLPATTTTTVAPSRPYQLASTTLPLVDHSRPTVSHGRSISSSRALTTLAWYPAAPGRWPLVVFAHGYQAGPSPYVTMLESWASHGYVVAAPEFPLTDQDVAGANLDENDINNQPADVRFVTDSLIAGGSSLASRIDPTRVALAGHSDGAETALAESVSPPVAGEPAFRALIAMSVQELPGVNHTSNPPMLVTQGDADTINPPSYGYTTYQDGSSPRYLLVLKGGGHLPPVQAGSAWLPGIEAVTEAFLDTYVASDAGAPQIRASVPASPLFAFSSA